MKKGWIALGLVGAVTLLCTVGVTAAPTVVGADKCKMCHKLQYDSWAATKHATQVPKVECETCHGPGSDYKMMAIMKDPAKAAAAGLIAKPDKAMCTAKCHKAKWSDDMLEKTHAHKPKVK